MVPKINALTKDVSKTIDNCLKVMKPRDIAEILLNVMKVCMLHDKILEKL